MTVNELIKKLSEFADNGCGEKNIMMVVDDNFGGYSISSKDADFNVYWDASYDTITIEENMN